MNFVPYALFAAYGELAGALELRTVAVDRVEQRVDAAVGGGDGLEHWRSPGAGAREVEHGLEIVDRGGDAVAVGLVDDEHVADLEQPGLRRLHAVAPPRVDDDHG